MTKEEVLASVKKVLVKTFELDEKLVVPTARFYEDLDLDSLDAIDLAVTLKTETGIKLKEQEMKAIRTVADIVDVVYRRLSHPQTVADASGG